MSDCNDINLQSLLNLINDLASGAGQAWKDFVSTTSGTASQLWSSADGLLSNSVAAHYADLYSNMEISDLAGETFPAPWTTLITLISTVLTSAQLGYLALAAFLFYLLVEDLQQRINLWNLFIQDLNALNDLLVIILNSAAFRQSELSSDNIKRAYKHVTKATTFVGEAKDQLKNLNYFQPGKITNADTELSSAETILKNPLQDTLQQMIKDADLFGTKRKEEEEDNNDETTDKWEEQKNNLLEGIAEYVGFDSLEGAIAAKSIVIEIAKDIGKYLPLDLASFSAITTTLAGWEKTFTGKQKASWEDVTEALSERSLFNLNTAIQQKITLLSLYPDNWKLLNGLSKALPAILDPTYKNLSELKNDMGDYVNPTGIAPITSNIGLSLQMSIWKKKIDNIQSLLNAIKPAGQQQADVEAAERSLEVVVAKFNNIKTLYNNDNKYTPESEGAFELMKTLLGTIWHALSDPKSLKTVQHTVAECLTSIHNAKSADSNLVSSLQSFISSVLTIEGVQALRNGYENLLNTEKYTADNNPVVFIIEEIKKGNLIVLTNSILGSAAEITGAVSTGVDGIKTAIEAVSPNGSVNVAVTSALDSVFDCFSNNEDISTEDLAKKIEEQDVAIELATTTNEKFKNEMATENANMEAVNNKIEEIQGKTEKLDVYPEEIEALEKAVLDVYPNNTSNKLIEFFDEEFDESTP